MYQELLAWTSADPKVSPNALPEALARALHSALQHQLPSHPSCSAAQASAGAVGKGKGGADRISLATFVVALCIVAMQVGQHCFELLLVVFSCDVVCTQNSSNKS